VGFVCRNSPTKQCWPSVPKARMADFRRRRYGGTRSATGAPRLRSGGGLGKLSRKARRGRGKSWVASAPKVRCAATRGCCKRVKGTPYEAKTRGAACKGVSAVRKHAGGLYDAGSYCYTLVKCLKPFARNGKGVIDANDYTQGSPINSEALVMKRTHCNEKRAPKATTCYSVFVLLSIALSLLLFC
jgi:hypothetical protein